ncbi:MAG TPA: glycine zipper 2TM domain-containing protein [Burkholderiales bacterium]
MRIHPLMAGAAASVIVACGVGVAAMTGVLPRTQAEKAEVPPPTTKKECVECGTVVSVRLVEQKGEGTGLGAVVGGVAGAVVGHEIAHGRDVGTVVGAAGGAFAGHEIERQARTTKHYEVRVQMSNGESRIVRFAAPPAWRRGDKVRLQDGKLVSA